MNGKKWISASIAAAMVFSISAVPAVSFKLLYHAFLTRNLKILSHINDYETVLLFQHQQHHKNRR